MKKTMWLFLVIAVMVITGTLVFASGEDYDLFIDYNENVFKGVPVQADVKLVGNEAPPYTNVRVKVDISGPATPTVMATDSLGNELDIAQLGYWGPDAGFAVGGTFTNTTPVTATFPEEGLYEITLSLINVTDGSTIATSTESIYVYRDQAELDDVLNSQNQIANNVVENTAGNSVGNNIMNNATSNAVPSIPQTGTSFAEYAVYAGIILAICLVGYVITRNYRIKL